MRLQVSEYRWIFSVLALAIPSGAATWYVTPTGGGLGNSWSSPTTLQGALSSASAGDNIWVQRGTYVPSVQYSADPGATLTAQHATFRLPTRVRVFGGFRGPDSSDPNNPFPGESSLQERDEDAHPTILSGDIGTPTPGDAFDPNDVYHVVTAHNVNELTKLSGFTIRNGYADAPASQNDAYGRFGGGILIVGTGGVQSSLHVTRCVIKMNWANNRGGGVAIEWSELPSDPNDIQPARLVNCHLQLNLSDSLDPNDTFRAGGGVSVENAAFEVTNTVFYNNTAKNFGGGFFAHGTSAGDPVGPITN